MDVHQIAFTNLNILGFDPFAMERKWRIPFNKEMFNLPNKKGFEAVMHFLFEKLNLTKCREQFRDCWPVTDKKEEQEFRKVVNSWLSELSKEPDAHFPRIVPSLFLSPGGEKLYFLLVAFSRFVIHKLITHDYGYKQRDFLRPPVLTSQNQCMSSMLQVAVQRQAIQYRKLYLSLVQEVMAVEEEWKHFAKGEVHEYRGLSSQIRELERQVKVELQKSLQLSHTSPSSTKNRNKVTEYDSNVQSIKRAQRVQKVRDQWRTLDEMNRHRAGEREVVESILEGTLDNYRVNGSQLNVKIPELLLRECEKEIQRRGVENIYEGGKLNLISLLHLWNLSLHLYIEKIHQAGLPDFDKANPTLTTQQHTSHAYLTNLQSLRIKLEKETICELKESVEMRKKELDELVLSSKSPKSVRSTCLGFGLMPPTPPVSFEPAKGKTPSNMVFRVNSLEKDSQGSTPEAALLLMDSINKRVASQSGSPLIQGSPVYAPRLEVATKQSPGGSGQVWSPLGEGSEVVKKGSKQLTKRKTAPGKQRPHQQHQITRAQARAPAKSSSSGSVKETSSGTQLIRHSKVKGKKAKQELTDQVSVSSTVTYQKGRYQLQRTSTPPLGGSVTEVHLDTSVLSSIPRSPPPEEDTLVDRLVDELLTEDSPREVLGQDHTSPDGNLLVKDPFQSKDMLHRTPEKSGWQDLLDSSYGPLSSTRLDGSSKTVERGDRDKVVTRLVLSPQQTDDAKTPQASSLHASSRQETYGAERNNVDFKVTPHHSPHNTQSAKRHTQNTEESKYRQVYRNQALEDDPYGENSLKFSNVTPNMSGVGALSDTREETTTNPLTWGDIQQKLSFGTDASESYRLLSESATPTLPARGSTGRTKHGEQGEEGEKVAAMGRSQNSSSSGNNSSSLKVREKKTTGSEEQLITFDTPPEIDATVSQLSYDGGGPVKAIDVLSMTPKKEGTEYNLGIFDLNLIEGLENLGVGRRPKDPSPSTTEHRVSQSTSHSFNTTLTEMPNIPSDGEDTMSNHVKWKDLEQEIRNADQRLHDSQLTSFLASDLEGNTVKVTHFQDGSFNNEFQDKSPLVKHPRRTVPLKYNTSPQSDTDNSERSFSSTDKDKDMEDSIKSVTSQEIHTYSNTTSDWNHQSAEEAQTDSLIARYKKLRSAQVGNEVVPLQTPPVTLPSCDNRQSQTTIKSVGNDKFDGARLASEPWHQYTPSPQHPSSPSSSSNIPTVSLTQQPFDDQRYSTETTSALKPFSSAQQLPLQLPPQEIHHNSSFNSDRQSKFTLDFDESFEHHASNSDGHRESALSSIDDILQADPLAQAALKPFNMWSPTARGTSGASNRRVHNKASPVQPVGFNELDILSLTPMLYDSPLGTPSASTRVQENSRSRERLDKLVSLPSFPDIFGEDESLLVPASPP